VYTYLALKAFLCGVQWTDERQWAEFERKEISFKHKKNTFYCERGQTLEQVAQRGRGASILAGTQNLTGHGPEQPAVGGPTLRQAGWTRWLLEVLANISRAVILESVWETAGRISGPWSLSPADHGALRWELQKKSSWAPSCARNSQHWQGKAFLF